MDPTLIAIAAHSVERIVAVLLGGLAVYYGFRLFMVVPVETRGDGKIELPGISVVLAKAGPGLFFAAFGALVVIISLLRPIKVGGDAAYQGVTEAAVPRGETIRAVPQAQGPGMEQQLARIRLTVQTLNCMQRLSTLGAQALSVQDSDLAVRSAKLALLKSAWSDGAWGDYGAFEQWATGRVVSTASPAKALFEEMRADCPH